MWIICYHRALTDVFFLLNKFNFFPEVIVYYKTLTLLWVKKDEEDFLVAGESLRNFVSITMQSGYVSYSGDYISVNN